MINSSIENSSWFVKPPVWREVLVAFDAGCAYYCIPSRGNHERNPRGVAVTLPTRIVEISNPFIGDVKFEDLLQ